MSSAAKPWLIVPVEQQAREFDAKLLFACVAAERGFVVILGSRAILHRRVASLPRGIYVAKSLRGLSRRMFRILTDLGHAIVAWEEEGLVHLPAEQYYAIRLAPETVRAIWSFFAWGPANAELFQKYPYYDGTPVYATGNPRIDVLRPEIRGYFAKEAEQLRQRFGRFLLINSNFASLNHYLPGENFVQRMEEVAPEGHGDDYKDGYSRHFFALYDRFREMVPGLSRAFPKHTIVIRPHPVENHDAWLEIARHHPSLRVLHEGSVVPWLLAAEALIHNGCTTAVEAFVLGVPAIAYQPVRSEFDYELPSRLSEQTSDPSELYIAVENVLAGKSDPNRDAERWAIAREHMAALDGPLASDRIVDVLEELAPKLPMGRSPNRLRATAARVRAGVRASVKRMRSVLPDHRNSSRYLRHRFPGLSVEEVARRVGGFGAVTGRFDRLEVRLRERDIFEIQRT